MPDFEHRQLVDERLSELCGPDPFAEVVRSAEVHREFHGSQCGLYPAGPQVMRLVATIVRAIGATRILDLGTGFGYSALWLASAAGEKGTVDAIDRFPEHVAVARELAAQFGLSRRIAFTADDVSAAVTRLSGPYDLIHDDAWFAAIPPYLERVLQLLRPGGTLTMPNWFLLEDALSGKPRRDWSEFAGAQWGESTLAYARQLSSAPMLDVTWSFFPPLGIAVKRSGGG
jgi:predicted O-methyltransferase YrrM